jgi:hypothetical protein
MTSFNVGATASANTSASCAITIPSGVLTGDIMVLGIAVFNEVATAPVLSFSGGGGATWVLPTPLHDGSNPEQATNGVLYAYGFFYYAVATVSDPGATLTVTETGSPSGLTWFAMALGSYTGAGATQPDVAGANAANQVLSSTAPAETTGVAGDWYVGLELGGTNSAPTGSPPGTAREAITSSAGITAMLWDSNGPVGAAGTSIGGGTVHGGNSAPNNNYTVFTIGLQPASATGAAGTVQPLATFPAPRRKLARAVTGFVPVSTVNANSGPAGRVQPLTARPAPRRKLARAVTGFVPVTTTNAPPAPPVPQSGTADYDEGRGFKRWLLWGA